MLPPPESNDQMNTLKMFAWFEYFICEHLSVEFGESKDDFRHFREKREGNYLT